MITFSRRAAALVATGALALPAPGVAHHGLAIAFVPVGGDHRFEVRVTGLTVGELRALAAAECCQRLSVYVEQGDSWRDPFLPAMLGACRVETDALIFAPKFPLQPGLRYRAIFRLDRADLPAGTVVTETFRVPSRAATASTTVTAIYPSAEVLPENLLKFYVHFSAPMSRGQIYEHIHLNGDNGKAVELPFLEIDEELWDTTMTRLTLFIDPGRIKRGVAPLEEIGPALEEGKHFTLVIDDAWRDAAGNPLKNSARKRFLVGPPDRESPDPADWTVNAPKSSSRDPLRVAFPEPLDHALARRMIRPIGPAGEVVDGEAHLSHQERLWAFTPAQSWVPGQYLLSIQTTLEDLAGNNIGKPFEVDLFEGVQRVLTNSTLRRPFHVQ